MELGRLGLDGPTRRRASGRAAWRPGLRTGAERSTGPGCNGAGDSEDEEQRAAGGPGPKSWIRPVERSAHWSDDGGICTVARADFTCVRHAHGKCRYDRTGARSILFRSVISIMPFGRAAFKQGNKRAEQRKLRAHLEPESTRVVDSLIAGFALLSKVRESAYNDQGTTDCRARIAAFPHHLYAITRPDV